MRTAIALLAAALIASTLLTLGSELYLQSINSSLDDSAFASWFFVSILLAMASFTIGLLLHTAATRLGHKTLWHYLIGAAVIGVGLAAWQMDTMLSAFFHMSQWDVPLRIGVLAFGGCVGALMAASFWLIRRPDRDEPNPPTSPS
jgi:hypothetical protein